MQIYPSLASANQMRLQKEIERLKGHDRLHFDIEDGNFVPNITFGMKTIRMAREVTDMAFDAHLMVTRPLDYIDPLGDLGFQAVAFHWEAADYPSQVIGKIRRRNMKVGAALNPRTNAEEIKLYLDRLDYVLVLTSEPDGEGDIFQPAMLKKIEALRQMSEDIQIIADGGIAEKEFLWIKHLGTTDVVMGRAVFSANDPYERIQEFLRMK